MTKRSGDSVVMASMMWRTLIALAECHAEMIPQRPGIAFLTDRNPETPRAVHALRRCGLMRISENTFDRTSPGVELTDSWS